MHVRSWVRHFFWQHPLFWVAIGIPLFMQLSRLPAESWNVEILIARNLLEGHGFVVGPLDPPALWRPPLAVLLLLPIELLFQSPYYIYAVFGALTLVGLLVSVFYLMKLLGGTVAAHVSQLMVLITPAFTTLVGHQQHVMGYLLLFGMVTLSILLTLRSWYRAHWGRDVLAGLSWGVAFLARPEVMALFGIGVLVGLVFHRSLGVGRGRAGWRVAFQSSAFLAIYLPSVLIFATVQKRHDLIGQEPLITHYAGARLAGNSLGGDPDGEGYEDSVEQFGDPGKYGNSMLRFMMSHPEAIKDRVRQNAKSMFGLLGSGRLITLWSCVAFLLMSSALALARRPSLPRLPLLVYLTLLLASSPYFLLFHVDVRYCLLSVLLLVLSLLVVALVWWTWVASYLGLDRSGRRIVVLPTIVLALLCGHHLAVVLIAAPHDVANLRPWRQLARGFRQHVSIGGTPVLGFVGPQGKLVFGGDSLWLNYFTQTASPWCGRPDCYAGGYFPRDRIYSFKGKAQDYLWIPDNKVSSIKVPKEIVVRRLLAEGFGRYSLLRLSPPASPIGVRLRVNKTAR